MENLRKYTVALVQMDTGNDKGANLAAACRYIDEAAAAGAKLVAFPEVMNLDGENVGEGGGAETVPGYTTERLAAKAKEHGIYIHSGSLSECIPGEDRAKVDDALDRAAAACAVIVKEGAESAMNLYNGI